MTGPEHYREAERLIKVVSDNPGIEVGTDRVLAAAQVHATLALAAATAETPYREPEDGQYGIEADEQDCRTVGPF